MARRHRKAAQLKGAALVPLLPCAYAHSFYGEPALWRPRKRARHLASWW